MLFPSKLVGCAAAFALQSIFSNPYRGSWPSECRHYIDMMSTYCRSCVDIMSTSCRYYVDIMSMSMQYRHIGAVMSILRRYCFDITSTPPFDLDRASRPRPPNFSGCSRPVATAFIFNYPCRGSGPSANPVDGGSISAPKDHHKRVISQGPAVFAGGVLGEKTLEPIV